jgi:hypothetical protein
VTPAVGPLEAVAVCVALLPAVVVPTGGFTPAGDWTGGFSG